MATLKLVPSSHKSGAASLYVSGRVAEVPSGSDPDYTVLATNDSDKVQYVGGFVPTTAVSETFNLSVSGTDIPVGRTIFKYRVGMAGGDSQSVALKKAYANVPGTEKPQVLISSSTNTTYSAYASTLNGAVPTKANLQTAGMQVGYPASAGAFSINAVWVEAVYNDVPFKAFAQSIRDGATLTVDNPTLSANVQPASSGQRQKVIWEFSTNASFTADLKSYTEPDSMLRLSGVASSKLPDALKLFPGTWFARNRVVDEFGLEGLDTGYKSSASALEDPIAPLVISVSHPSSATQSAPSGTGFSWSGGNIEFNWLFSDTAAPLDSQTAYQIQVYADSNATLIVDTGKISSSNQSVVLIIPSMYDGLSLSWRIQTWDEGDSSSGYTGYQSFTAEAPPIISITSVAIDSPAPEVDWTFTSTGGSTQVQFLVQLNDTGSGTLKFSSGWVSGSATSYVVPVPAVLNAENVTATLTVIDSSGFSVTDTFSYTTAWDLPDSVPFTVDESNYGEDGFGFVKITWDDSVRDPQFFAYQVWRRNSGETTWTSVYSTTDIASTYEFDDYLASSSTEVDYAVIQTAIRFGSAEASAVPSDPVPTTVMLVSDNYWLIDNINSSNNLLVPHVTSDSFTDDKEYQIIQVIGRGQKADHGTSWGVNGTLTATVYGSSTKTAREIRKELVSISDNTTDLYLRTPFGDVFKVDIGTLSCDRVAGVGSNEFFTVSIPYSQVA